MKNLTNTLIVLVVLAIALGASLSAYKSYSSGSAIVNFRTAEVRRGDLTVSVTATGTLEPEDLVDVGAQVIGRVKELGADITGKQIDYCSVVEKNQILAIIDDSVYRAQRDQAKATLQRSNADLLQLKAKLAQTEAESNRAQKLRSLKLTGLSPANLRSGGGDPVEIKGISDADFVLAKSNYEAAKANIKVGEAAIEQNTASLELAETNLGYTVIRSPVSGTIIDRRVNIGQTVVSSLNAPSLFLIAKDLKRMQVWASVNEADIGLLKKGTPVKFTVDAFPEDVFDGTVVQVRYNASSAQNVVTYTVVIANDNSDLKLLPYLTANVKFLVKQIPNALLVPNAALRYQPPANRIAPDAKATTSGTETPSAAPANVKPGTVWKRQGNFVVPIPVKLGETDDSFTEIHTDQLTPGDEVVLGELQVVSTEEVNNPFAPPKMPKNATPKGPPPP